MFLYSPHEKEHFSISCVLTFTVDHLNRFTRYAENENFGLNQTYYEKINESHSCTLSVHFEHKKQMPLIVVIPTFYFPNLEEFKKNLLKIILQSAYTKWQYCEHYLFYELILILLPCELLVRQRQWYPHNIHYISVSLTA